MRTARFARRAALSTGGLLLALAGLEGGLRIAGSLARPRAAPSRGFPGGALRVLCVGDSHTFGLAVPPEAAYPAQLERLLDEREPSRPHRVLNLGMPGLDSAGALDRLAGALPSLRPDAAVLWFGLNDVWSRRAGRIPSPLLSLRTVRLARILALRLAGPALDAPPEAGPRLAAGRNREGESETYEMFGRREPLAADGLAEAVRATLEEALRRCRGAGAVPIVLGYPREKGEAAAVNRGIRAGARGGGALLVETAAAFEAAVRRFGEKSVLFPDGHPKVLGYTLVAERVFDSLVEAGLVAASPRGDPVERLAAALSTRAPADPRPERKSPSLRLRKEGSGRGSLVLELRDQPDTCYRILLSEGDSPATEILGVRVPLRDDALFRATLDSSSLRGVVGRSGIAEIPIGELRDAASPAPGSKFFAAYVVFAGPDDAEVVDVSGAAALEVP